MFLKYSLVQAIYRFPVNFIVMLYYSLLPEISELEHSVCLSILHWEVFSAILNPIYTDLHLCI